MVAALSSLSLLKPMPRLALAATVIVPTFKEVENIPLLVARLQGVRTAHDLDLELLLMDDDSRDGTEELVHALDLSWVRVITRKAHRGLSAAVIDGLSRSKRDYVVVMDADLSHPPEKIPELLKLVRNGADLAVGSRFTEGGSTADDWGPFRWLNSRIASLLAFPLTTIDDPMSGFFAMRRATLAAATELNPLGYKILLEIIVRCRCRLIAEVPIHFSDRRFGVSKLSFAEQFQYFRHLRRLYNFRYGKWSHFAQFLAVGASGVAVNLFMLTTLMGWEVAKDSAVGAAIVLSMFWNFLLNRRFSFPDARQEPAVRQFLKFVAACSVGGCVNFLVTVALWTAFSHKQMAAVAGVVAGTLFNFGASRFLVFRARYVKA